MFTQNWNKETIKNLAFLERNSMTRICEIGVFEGGTTNYFVENLLNNDGIVVGIDPLDDGYDLDGDNHIFKGQYERFTENIKHNEERIWHIRKSSQAVLPTMRDNSFDLVFVDGDHRYNSVTIDGTEAFRICKVGGYVLFDDYTWGLDRTGEMKNAIDAVLANNPNHRLLLKLNQVLIQKLPEGSPTEDGQDEYQNKSVEILFGWDKIHAEYCNLDIRPDRNLHMMNELKRVGVPIARRRSFPWQEVYDGFNEEQKEKVQVMLKRTAGAIGCHYSQVAVMEEALKQGKHAFVCEDDLLFCDDFPKRLNIIYKFLNQHEWDIFWFGGTYHKEGHWHVSVEGKHTHPDLQMCNCNLNRDWEPTLNPHIVRTYGAFSTHAYLVNKDRIQNLLDKLDRNVHRSMGIDFICILEQPDMNTFAFDPGCIKQMDSMSNISNGMAVQSGFARLGKHFWAASMDDK